MQEASFTLPAELSSVAQARRLLREALATWGVDGYDIGGPQVLTELATNAALHARTTYTVHLRLEPDTLLIEVSDSSPARPQLRHYGPDATTGRGIALVEALSKAWGVEASPTGKTVWCRIGTDDASGGPVVDEHLEAFPGQGRPGPAGGVPGNRPGSVMALAA